MPHGFVPTGHLAGGGCSLCRQLQAGYRKALSGSLTPIPCHFKHLCDRYEPKSAPHLSCIQSHQTPLECYSKPETFSTEDHTWQRIQWPHKKVRRSKALSLLFAEDKECKLCAITLTFSCSGFLGSPPCVKAFEIILQWKKNHINNPKSFPAEIQTTTITLRREFFLLP